MIERIDVKKYLNKLFLNITPKEEKQTWQRVTTSTDFAIAMNAETETLDFIADENPTDVLKSYKPTISQTQKAYIGDPIFDFLFALYEKQGVGTDAVTQGMIVFQQDAETASGNTATGTSAGGSSGSGTGSDTSTPKSAKTTDTTSLSAKVAQMFDALITLDTYDLVAQTMTYSISQAGTPIHGTATLDSDGKPVFTAEEAAWAIAK